MSANTLNLRRRINQSIAEFTETTKVYIKQTVVANVSTGLRHITPTVYLINYYVLFVSGSSRTEICV